MKKYMIGILACVTLLCASAASATSLFLPPPPNAPTNPLLAPTGSTSVVLGWTDNSTNETGWYIYAASDLINPNYQLLKTVTNSSWTTTTGLREYYISGLTSGQCYLFEIASFNSYGTSAFTSAVEGPYCSLFNPLPVIINAPPSPTSFVATAISPNNVSLSWYDQSGDERSFVVYQSTDGITYSQIATTASSLGLIGQQNGTITFPVTGLAANTSYWFKVVASNDVGQSAPVVTTVHTPSAPPPAPSGLTASAVDSSSIKLSWLDNATNENGFTVQASTDGTNFSTKATLSDSNALIGQATGVITYTVAGLTPQTAYWFKVNAFNAIGASSFVTAGPVSTLASAATQQTQLPIISSLQASEATDQTITITWSGTATQYTAQNTTLGTSSGWVSGSSYTFSGLTCGTSYAFQVQGKALDGTLSNITTVNASTLACAANNQTNNTNTTPSNSSTTNTNGTSNSTISANASLDPSCPALSPGQMVRVIGKAAIYVLNDKLQTLYFPSGDEFKSWNADDKYGNYTFITAPCYDSLGVPQTLPAAVNFRPGSFVVKRASSSQLYVVEPHNTLAPITADAARALYGTGYKVMTIADIFWSQYTNRGSAITDAVPHPGMLVQEGGTTWYVDDGQILRQVTSDGFAANRFRTSFMHSVPSNTVAGWTQGLAVNSQEDLLSSRLEN